jgi:hypothetical protein
MTQADFGLALTVFLIVASFTLTIRLGSYRQEQKKHRCYPLFKVRDAWVYLVAAGKLDKGDPLFLYYFDFVNIILRYSSDMTLRRLVAAIHRAEEQQASLKIQVQGILPQLDSYDPAVKAIVWDIYQATATLLIENSRVLSLLSRYPWLNYFLYKTAVWTRRLQDYFPYREAYLLAKRYGQASVTSPIIEST